MLSTSLKRRTLMSLYVQALASEVSKGKHKLDAATIISGYSDLANLSGPR